MNKEKIKKIRALYYPYRYIAKPFVSIIKELSALNNIAKLKKKSTDYRNIIVLFILQYEPSWEKADLLYKYLDTQKDFDAYILCVPNDIENINCCNNTVYLQLHQYDYKVIDAVKNGRWFDIKQLNPDYIITFRPYDNFMPEVYSAQNLSKIGKLCNIIYGPPMTKELQSVVYNKTFFDYVSIFFSESIEAKEFFENHHRIGVKLGLQSAPFCGMPILEYINKKEKNHEISAWKQSNLIKVLWTPRWNTDEKVGGSHFFDYNEILVKYKNSSIKKFDLMFRPHPLMFSNFEKTGEMSSDERDGFFELCKRNDVLIDLSKPYLYTLQDTDILITDISSIVQEFFVLGKPIIYCPPSSAIHPTQTMQKITSVCYVVNNSTELLTVLDQLLNGKDDLKSDRAKVLNEIFGNTLDISCKQIAEKLRSN